MRSLNRQPMSLEGFKLIHLGLLLFRLRPRLLRVRKSAGDAETIWVDVTRSSKSCRTTGIERVTREISARFEDLVRDTTRFTIRFFGVSFLGVPYEVPNHFWATQAPESRSPKTHACIFTEGDTLLLLDLSLAPRGLNRREIKFLRSKKIKLVTVVYDTLPLAFPHLFPPHKRAIFFEWVQTIRHSDGFVYISNASKASFRQLTGQTNSQESPGELVIKLGPLVPEPTSPPQKSRRPTKDRALRVLAVGTVEPRKDYDGLLDALDVLWNDGHSVSLAIIGRLGWKAKDTVKRIESHPRLGRELFWNTDASDSELRRHYETADCLVANSIAEGFGLPLIEAAAFGLPVVARNIDVFKEILPEAVFFEGGDPRALAEKLLSVHASVRQQAMNGRRSLGKYSWDAATRDILGLLSRD